MADPFVTLPAAIGATSMAASAIGGATDIFGKLFQGGAQANMFKYQAGVAQINKTIAEQNATYAREVGETEAQKSGMQTRATQGKIAVMQGASGVQVGSKSSQDVRESVAELGRYDQALIRSNAAKQAYGYEVEATQAAAQGELYKASAKTAKTSAKLGAISSLLTTAGSVSSKWLQGKELGIWGG